MLLDTTNGHDRAIVDKFNKLAEKFDHYGLLELILKNFCDDQDLEEITNLLEERIEQNEVEEEENKHFCECGEVATTHSKLTHGTYCDDCIKFLEEEGYH